MNNRRRRVIAEQSLYSLQQGRIQKPDVYGTRRKVVKKVIQDLNQGDDQDEFPIEDVTLLDSDTITAAKYLISSNPKSSIPMCFVHQIYSILPNNTIVDRELQEAIQAGTWRKFHIIGSLEDEFVIMETTNYIEAIGQSQIECIKEGTDDPKVFDIFRDVVMCHNNVSIKKEILVKDFNMDEKQIAQLVSSGYLLPHSSVLGLYWFSVQNQGKFMSNLSGGRTEILRIIKKRNTKDIMEKLLKQKKLHKTIFNFEFLMHDLVGSGRVEK